MLKTQIIENVRRIIAALPDDVELEAAAKTRSADEALAAVKGGVKILGYNYVQEAEAIKAQAHDRPSAKEQGKKGGAHI